MRLFALFIALLLIGQTLDVIAQNTQTGPVLEEFGAVFAVPDADLILTPDTTHKVIFDVYTDPGGEAEMNPLLNTVARFLNMHAQNGLDADKMQVAVVLHGAGMKNALSDESYKAKYGRDNPNTRLLTALEQAGVELFVCGQSMKSRGFAKEDLAAPLKLSLSAMTALVHFQENGYQIINFN